LKLELIFALSIQYFKLQTGGGIFEKKKIKTG